MEAGGADFNGRWMVKVVFKMEDNGHDRVDKGGSCRWRKESGEDRKDGCGFQ